MLVCRTSKVWFILFFLYIQYKKKLTITDYLRHYLRSTILHYKNGARRSKFSSAEANSQKGLKCLRYDFATKTNVNCLSLTKSGHYFQNCIGKIMFLICIQIYIKTNFYLKTHKRKCFIYKGK